MMRTDHKLSVVTIVHNQGNNLAYILKSYAEQSMQPDLYVFVLDRCTDNSNAIIQKFKEDYSICVEIVHIQDSVGFSAGRNRDIGLAHAESTIGYCSVLFLDGDCIPSLGCFEAHKRCLEYSSITIGLRIDTTEDGSIVSPDQRLHAPWCRGKVFVHGQDNLVSDMALARQRLLTWSCCLGLNSKAIKELRRINNTMFNDCNRVFAPAFDGKWGGEDDFIGLTAMLFGLDVVAIDPVHCINHIWHKPRTDDSFMENARIQFQKLKELAVCESAPGLRFIDDDMQARLQHAVLSMACQ